MSSGEAITSDSNVATTATQIYAAGTFTSATSTDKTLTHYNQGVLAPSSNVVLAALKIRAQREDMKLKTLNIAPVATSDGTAVLSSLRIYADDGTTALSDPIAIDTSGTYDNEFSFASADDWDDDILFEKNVYRTILLVGNISTADTNFYLKTVANTDLVLTGVTSGADANASGGINFYIESPYYGGKFQVDATIVEITKASDSPSGTVTPTSKTIVGKWDVANMDALLANAVITTIKFTCKTGLPAAITGTTDATLFKLYDADGTELSTSRTLDQSAGTIEFASIGTNLTVESGVPKTMELRIDFTDSGWGTVDLTQQWSIEAQGDVTVTGGYPGFGSTNWSIPAETNEITINL